MLPIGRPSRTKDGRGRKRGDVRTFLGRHDERLQWRSEDIGVDVETGICLADFDVVSDVGRGCVHG